MSDCTKCKYRRISDFPEKYVSMLMSIETKREMIEHLMGFMEMHRLKKEKNPRYQAHFNWDSDIQRISNEFAGLLSLLPSEIRDQYDRFIEIREMYNKAADYLANGDPDRASKTWALAKSMMCCGEEDHCGE